jgi:GT2 family glycosyltransferase
MAVELRRFGADLWWRQVFPDRLGSEFAVSPRFAADFNAPLEAGEPVPFPCAGAAMIHRDVCRELGGWDTAFFLDHEDINLFIRAWQRGWKAVQVPGAKVFHAVNASSAQMLTRLNLSVSRRRYVSRRANLTAIAIKYFSWRAVALAALVWPAVVLNNLVRLWGSCLRGDWEVLRELWRRWPWLLAFSPGQFRLQPAPSGQGLFPRSGAPVDDARLLKVRRRG